MRYLITGTAGFIGFHLARRLLDEGHFVVGFDAMTPYYDVALKVRRHAILAQSNGFRPVIARLEDRAALDAAAALAEPDVIVHLAAQLLALGPRGRIAARLLTFAAGGEVALSQSDLAEMCGLSRKATNAHLAALERAGAIARGYGRIAIIDAGALRRLAA